MDEFQQQVLERLAQIVRLLEGLSPHLDEAHNPHLVRLVPAAVPSNARTTNGKYRADFAEGQSQTENPDARIDSQIQQFLTSRGISIKSVPAPSAADPVIDSLSEFIGDRYEAVAKILAKIKRAMQMGTSFTENLKGSTQIDISSVCQLCNRLYQVAFLTEYKYERAPKFIIHGTASTLPSAQKFFSGQWLERFILQKVKTSINSLSLTDWSCLINPQIKLPNGDDFELDVLVRVSENFYWIEAKTGVYQQYVEKYSRMARLLGLDYKHSIMVLGDYHQAICDQLSALFTMNVTNIANFPELFKTILNSDVMLPGRSP